MPHPCAACTGATSGMTELRVAVVGADHATCTALAQGLQRDRPSARASVVAGLPGPHHHLTLLCALTRPSAEEMRLRATLTQAGVSHQVLHGPPEAQLRCAIDAIDLIASRAYPTSAATIFSSQRRLRAWGCEKCSDPECEHRLFTALRGE